jgi:hypothetical protein
MDMEGYPACPTILERYFLRTIGAMINMKVYEHFPRRR